MPWYREAHSINIHHDTLPRTRRRSRAYGSPRRISRFGELPGAGPIVEERRPRGKGKDPMRLRRRSSSIDSEPRRRRRRRRSSSIDIELRRRRSSTHSVPSLEPPIVLPPFPHHTSSRKRKGKKKLYFVRPQDGHPHHRRGRLGRLADALTGEGPDVFVTGTTRQRLHRDRPQRWQWSGHGLSEDEVLTKIAEPGFEWRELRALREMPWARRAVGIGEDGWNYGYDWRSRKFGGHGEHIMTDARWREGARRCSWQEAVRDGGFEWW